MTRKFVWVTGASSGIGKSLVKEFISAGFNVFATARRMKLLNVLKSECDSDKLLTFQCDIAKKSEIQDAIIFLRENTGVVECLVNNAGITSFSSAEKDELSVIENIIETNLLGAIYAIKAVLPDMIINKQGWIISILSVVAQKVFANSSAYSASKLGLLGYTNSMREEVRQHNIRVTNVLPGATITPIWSKSTIDKNASRMMKSTDLAKLIVQLYSSANSVVPEEITMRPVLGDL